jgi:hypothetical protein
MLSSHISYIIAQQRIIELQRSAAHDRAAHSNRDSRRARTNAGRVFFRRLRPHRAAAQPGSRQDPTVGIAADTRAMRCP